MGKDIKNRRLFTLSDVLGLREQFGVLVLDGHLFRLSQDKVGRDALEWSDVYGSRRGVEPVDSVPDLFLNKLYACTGAEKAFRVQALKTPDDVNRSLKAELGARVQQHECLDFVVNKLIPHLKRIAYKPPRIDRCEAVGKIASLNRGIDILTGLDQRPRNLVQEVLGGDVLILGQCVYRMDWIHGNERPRNCFVQAQGESYAIRTDERRLLMDLEKQFQKKLKETLQSHMLQHGNDWFSQQVRRLKADLNRVAEIGNKNRVIYRDSERSVVVAEDGTLYCCQMIPPFIMACSDYKYRVFKQIQVGVKIDTLDRDDLFLGGAQMMSKYEHVFVSNAPGSGHLCMGDTYALIRSMQEMSLVEAIVEFLNAARLVLCAGNFESASGFGHTGYCSDTHLNCPIVSKQEANELGYPVYHYYRTEMN